MVGWVHRRLTYANVTATLALVFALGGTAIAAHHYLISSTKQISPSVLKSLRGGKGPRGAQGVQGNPGTPGQPGQPGANGISTTFESYKDAAVATDSLNANAANGVVGLTLGAGSYQVIAKVHAFITTSISGYTPINCVLSGGGQNDTARATLSGAVGDTDATLTMIATAHVPPDTTSLEFVACWKDNASNTISANQARLVAIQVNTASANVSG